MAAHGMRDFTQGSIPRHLVAFTVPMLLGNLLQALYNTVDSFWVGRFIGPAALAAVSVSFPIIFAVVALAMGLALATTVLVSQAFGAGRQDLVRRVVGNSLLLLSLGGLACTIGGVSLRTWILEFINTPAAIMEQAGIYLGLFFLGLVPLFINNTNGAILRGLGDSRSPLRFLICATVLNVVLDPVLIFGVGPIPPLGIAGVAIATVLSETLAAALGILHLRRLGMLGAERSAWRLDRRITRDTFRIGAPAGLQQLMVSLSLLAVVAIVNTFGKTVVAAAGAASRLDQFAFLPAFSVSLAVSSLVGQNLGAGKDERVREIVQAALLFGCGLTLAASIAALAVPGALLGLFTRDPAVIAEGVIYLRYIGFSYIPFAAMFAMMGVIRGAGDTPATLVVTFISLWLVRVPLASYLASLETLGPRGVWLATLISPCVGFTLAYGYFLTGRWKRKVVVRALPGQRVAPGGPAHFHRVDQGDVGVGGLPDL